MVLGHFKNAFLELLDKRFLKFKLSKEKLLCFKTFCWYCTTSGIQKQVLQDIFCHIAIFKGKFCVEFFTFLFAIIKSKELLDTVVFCFLTKLKIFKIKITAGQKNKSNFIRVFYCFWQIKLKKIKQFVFWNFHNIDCF